MRKSNVNIKVPDTVLGVFTKCSLKLTFDDVTHGALNLFVVVGVERKEQLFRLFNEIWTLIL